MSTNTSPGEGRSLDELLVHAGWLRGLPLRLVRDAAAADDLVQEAWLAALERPEAERRNPRAWLGGVIRNLARERVRGESRRRRREDVHAEQRESLPSPVELASRLELQRALADAVTALDEPYRSTVLLRFYEGLPAAEIARRSDVPAGTVRWRLKRGLDQLRDVLDQTHDGDRRAWVLALLPLAATAPDAQLVRPVAAARVASLLTGVVAMSLATKVLLGTATAAVLLVGLFAIQDPKPTAEPDVAATAPSDARPASRRERTPRERVQPPAPIDAAQTSATQEDADPAAESTAGEAAVVVGRVIDERGAPVAGARVVIPVLRTARPATTGDDGAYELRVGLPDETWSAAVVAELEGHSCEPRLVRLESGERIELANLVLRPGGVLVGRVVDDDGRPVEGADVKLGDASWAGHGYERMRRWPGGAHGRKVAETDAAGEFRAAGVPAGTQRVWVSKRGFLHTASDPVDVPAGGVAPRLDLVLEALTDKHLIQGTVFGPDGEPLPRAHLEYHYAAERGDIAGSGTFGADDDGRLRIVAQIGCVYRVVATSQDGRFAPAEVTGLRAGTTDAVLRLALPTTVALEVRDTRGNPVRAFRVESRAVGSEMPLQEIATTGDGDPARLIVPSMSFQLGVSGPGIDEAVVGPFEPGTVSDPLVVTVDRRPIVTGRVLGPQGAVAGAEVTAHLRVPDDKLVIHNGLPVDWDPRPVGSATTDAEGRFELGVPDEAEVRVRAVSGDLTPAIVEVGPGERRERVLHLGRGGGVEGRVLVPTGESATGLVVALSQRDGFHLTTHTDTEGRYRFDAVATGPWTAHVVPDDVVAAGTTRSTYSRDPDDEEARPWDLEVRAGETSTFDIDLRGGLVGHLEFEGASPQGWTAALLPAGADWNLRLEEGVALDSDGRFRLPPQPPGERRLVLRTQRGHGILHQRVRLRAEAVRWTARLVVTTVSGTNTRRDLGLLALRWTRADGLSSLIPVIGDDTGRFTLRDVPVGPHDLVRVDPDRDGTPPDEWPVLGTLDVPRDGLTDLDLADLLL